MKPTNKSRYTFLNISSSHDFIGIFPFSMDSVASGIIGKSLARRHRCGSTTHKNFRQTCRKPIGHLSLDCCHHGVTTCGQVKDASLHRGRAVGIGLQRFAVENADLALSCVDYLTLAQAAQTLVDLFAGSRKRCG